jgi:DNA polymerase III delta subunit
MIYILHGDDTAASRNFITEITSEFPTTILDGKSLNLSQLEENVVSRGFFEEEKAIVVENLLSQNKKKELVKFLNDLKSEILIVLWEGKKLTKTATNVLKKAEIHEFSYPSYYFQFLDSVTSKSGKRLYALYHDLLKTTSEEIIFYSLLKRIRLLVVIASGSTISELSKMAPWQQSKLNQQVRQWRKEELLEFYKQLQEIEIKMKTGKLPLGLSKHLDILILSHLT